MQSYSTATDQGTVTENTPPSQDHRQHGYERDASDPPTLAGQDESGGVGAIFGAVNALGEPHGQAAIRPEYLLSNKGLSPPQTPSPGSRNRIAEYESASASALASRKRLDAPAFDVIKKPRKPGDMRSPISELPNEILTHALAHLSPIDLSSISMVSHRFHDLVTTPHAWRSAFARFFPGPDSIGASFQDEDDEVEDVLRTERRAFTRVTALASWRSEYILRTRLLRSLARAKPVQAIASPAASRQGQNHIATPTIMYNSQLFTTVNHLHATFGSGLNKRLPRFVHGADDNGTASSSDPAAGKIDSWGLGDPSTFISFADRFPGDTQYGLGSGELVGLPNVMDVSQPYGMVLGEGMPDGMVYFRFSEEMRGRFLASSTGISAPDVGIPKIPSSRESICSVWIAKASSIPSLTDGLVGIISGSSLGVLTTYSLGPLGARDQRFGRGEVTARWALSPGVPIIAIAVDEQHSLKRQGSNRIWAVALNALGEVFYLTEFPKRAPVEKPTHPLMEDELREKAAWLTGRTVYWHIAEPTRRSARPDPYGDAPVDGSYSPRTSWNGMCLGTEQIKAETREVEAYISRRPRDFQRACLGWDMRRRLEMDFAGDDGNGAGENVLVMQCGLEDGGVTAIHRFTRCKTHDSNGVGHVDALSLGNSDTIASATKSLFGGPANGIPNKPDTEPHTEDSDGSITPRPLSEEWRTSSLSLAGLKTIQITAATIDCSTFATLTAEEDPLLSYSDTSAASSPYLTPLSEGEGAASPADIPGQRARLVAVGTKMGSILLWNIRAPVAHSVDITNTIEPVRIVYTDSPQISCLALTALCLVHGGNDGLVQAWDPLASSLTPLRTLNSRFSSRARRRLIQAQASPQGVGINLFAAGAISLDPDPTVLRGIVSLGTHLLYWSYSSSAADQYKSHKRRLRRSERGSNAGGERISVAQRGNIKSFIANEKFELEQEKERRRREAAHMAGRFGTELLGDDASEEEMLAYAALLSEESLAQDASRRTTSDTSALLEGDMSADFVMPASPATRPADTKTDEELDADVAEAIRLSLATSASPPSDRYLPFEDEHVGFEIPIRYAKSRKASTPRNSPGKTYTAEGSYAQEDTELEFALQLSLAEEQSKRDAEAAAAAAAAAAEEGDGAFPALEPSQTSIWHGGNGVKKGKGRAP